MIKFGEFGWTRVSAGHYRKNVGDHLLEIKGGLLSERWSLYFDGRLCSTSSGGPAASVSFEGLVRDSERIAPCKDCGKIYPRLLSHSETSYCRCSKCARFHAELHIGYSEAARVVRRIDGIWSECDKIRAASSTRDAVEKILRGEI